MKSPRFPSTAALAACGLVLLCAPAGAEAPPVEAPSGTAHGRVTNIGLHIGGGPNDAKTKAPFKEAIAKSFDAFLVCYAKTETKEGTFGVDLLVPAEGGHPEVESSRTSMKGDGFRECVVAAFQAVEFAKPRRGATKLSYALKFEPAA